MARYYGQIVDVDPATMKVKVVYKSDCGTVAFHEFIDASNIRFAEATDCVTSLEGTILSRVQELNKGHDFVKALLKLKGEGKQICAETMPSEAAKTIKPKTY